jgi:hypothetical protein
MTLPSPEQPEGYHLRPQAAALLEAFQRAGSMGLTTGQLLAFTYPKECADGITRPAHIGDWRRRKSDLVEKGWWFEKTPVPEGGFRYVLKGQHPDHQLPLAGVAA